jgi:DNA-binding NarL/FixJ family response regulator
MGVADQGSSVLIVDDQLPFRLAARSVVGVTPGFTVVGEAKSGEEAVAQADELEPELVLMDINMPGIGGIEATRRITAAHPAMRVILLSTYDADDLPADARTCGAVAYVHKEQFGPDVLTRTWADGDGIATDT